MISLITSITKEWLVWLHDEISQIDKLTGWLIRSKKTFFGGEILNQATLPVFILEDVLDVQTH